MCLHASSSLPSSSGRPRISVLRWFQQFSAQIQNMLFKVHLSTLSSATRPKTLLVRISSALPVNESNQTTHQLETDFLKQCPSLVKIWAFSSFCKCQLILSHAAIKRRILTTIIIPLLIRTTAFPYFQQIHCFFMHFGEGGEGVWKDWEGIFSLISTIFCTVQNKLVKWNLL